MKLPLTINWPGVVALGLVLTAIAVVEVFGGDGASERLIQLVLLGAGAGGAFLPSLLRTDPSGPPPSGPLAVLVIAASAVTFTGCGASAVQTHARAAEVSARVVGAMDRLVVDARQADADAAEAASVGQPTEERLAAVARARGRWTPAREAVATLHAGVGAWIDGIALAVALRDEHLSLQLLTPLASRVLTLYDAAAALLRSLGVEAPPLPSFLHLGGSDVAR